MPTQNLSGMGQTDFKVWLLTKFGDVLNLSFWLGTLTTEE
jgi:hypothetical protein